MCLVRTGLDDEHSTNDTDEEDEPGDALGQAQ